MLQHACGRRHRHRAAGHLPLHRGLQAPQGVGRAAAVPADDAHWHRQRHLMPRQPFPYHRAGTRRCRGTGCVWDGRRVSAAWDACGRPADAAGGPKPPCPPRRQGACSRLQAQGGCASVPLSETLRVPEVSGGGAGGAPVSVLHAWGAGARARLPRDCLSVCSFFTLLCEPRRPAGPCPARVGL